MCAWLSVSLNPIDCTMTVFLGCLNGDVEYLLVYWSQFLECLNYGPNLFFNISMGNFVLFCYLLQLGCSIFLISFIVPEFFSNLEYVIQLIDLFETIFFPILPFDSVPSMYHTFNLALSLFYLLFLYYTIILLTLVCFKLLLFISFILL